jgi:hypothetical protein
LGDAAVHPRDLGRENLHIALGMAAHHQDRFIDLDDPAIGKCDELRGHERAQANRNAIRMKRLLEYTPLGPTAATEESAFSAA